MKWIYYVGVTLLCIFSRVALAQELSLFTFHSRLVEHNEACGRPPNYVGFTERITPNKQFTWQTEYTRLLIAIDATQGSLMFTKIPEFGDLYLCADKECTTKGQRVTLSRRIVLNFEDWFGYSWVSSYEVSMIYVPNDNYFNSRVYTAYVPGKSLASYSDKIDINGRPLPMCSNDACVDSYEYIAYGKKFFSPFSYPAAYVRHYLHVANRMSVPTFSYLPDEPIGLVRDLNKRMDYIDPDGDTFLTEFHVSVDEGILYIPPDTAYYTDFRPPLRVEGNYTVFYALASELMGYFSRMSIFGTVSSQKMVRLQIAVARKIQARPFIVSTEELCGNDTATAVPTAVFYVTILTSSPLNGVILAKNSRDQIDWSLLYQESYRANRGAVTSSNDGVLTYKAYDPYSFSVSGVNAQCQSRFYDYIGITNWVEGDSTSPGSQSYCSNQIKFRANVCIHDRQHIPIARETQVKNVFENQSRNFIVDVFDLNDQTVGEDDGLLSKYAFRAVNGSVTTLSGIVFDETVFESSEIRAAGCVGDPLIPGEVYRTTAFCYMTTGPTDYRYVSYVALDEFEDVSVTGLILFYATPYFVGCTADATTGPYYPECTSSGRESNDLFGDTFIPVAITIISSVEVDAVIGIVVVDLPSWGVLYHCVNIGRCTQRGDVVKIGDRVFLPIGTSFAFLFRGNDDYYNYNNMIYRKTVRVTDDFERFLGYDTFYMFSQRNDQPILICDGWEDNGCPDFFLYRLDAADGDPTVNRVNLYVQNIGSRSYFTGLNMDITTSNTTMSMGFLLNFRMLFNQDGPRKNELDFEWGKGVNKLKYVDLDGDAFDVTVEIYINRASIGFVNDLYNIVYYRKDDRTSCFENGECAGWLTIVGIPSDIQYALDRLYVVYMRYCDRGLEIENLFIRAGKLFAYPSDSPGLTHNPFDIPIYEMKNEDFNNPLMYYAIDTDKMNYFKNSKDYPFKFTTAQYEIEMRPISVEAANLCLDFERDYKGNIPNEVDPMMVLDIILNIASLPFPQIKAGAIALVTATVGLTAARIGTKASRAGMKIGTKIDKAAGASKFSKVAKGIAAFRKIGFVALGKGAARLIARRASKIPRGFANKFPPLRLPNIKNIFKFPVRPKPAANIIIKRGASKIDDVASASTKSAGKLPTLSVSKLFSVTTRGVRSAVSKFVGKLARGARSRLTRVRQFISKKLGKRFKRKKPKKKKSKRNRKNKRKCKDKKKCRKKKKKKKKRRDDDDDDDDDGFKVRRKDRDGISWSLRKYIFRKDRDSVFGMLIGKLLGMIYYILGLVWGGFVYLWQSGWTISGYKFEDDTDDESECDDSDCDDDDDNDDNDSEFTYEELYLLCGCITCGGACARCWGGGNDSDVGVLQDTETPETPTKKGNAKVYPGV